MPLNIIWLQKRLSNQHYFELSESKKKSILKFCLMIVNGKRENDNDTRNKAKYLLKET